jgi:PEP-CTERM motif/Thioester domain
MWRIVHSGRKLFSTHGPIRSPMTEDRSQGLFRPERLVFMRKRLRLLGFPRLGLALGLLAFLTCEAKADLTVNDIGLYDGSTAPIVEIQCTGNSGVWVYGAAQTATNWTFPNGSSVPLYCIDLTHENAVGDSYALNPWSNPSFSTSGYSDAANRIAWAIENGGLSSLGTAAAQLLVWSITDKNFSVINWNGNSALQTTYNNLVRALGNPISGYNSNENYLSGVEFFSAVHDPTDTLYQNLAVLVPAPEPSTLAIATLGALGFVGYGWRRRTQS